MGDTDVTRMGEITKIYADGTVSGMYIEVIAA